MKRYNTVALGGTFDYIHKGHRALLSKAFQSGQAVLIGITSDGFAERRSKKLNKTYEERVRRLEEFIKANYPGGRYEIRPLEDYFGPRIYDEDVDAIVVSRETENRKQMANDVRRTRGVKPLEKIVVETVLADDGRPVSSTRIRLGEIDEEGHVVGKRTG